MLGSLAKLAAGIGVLLIASSVGLLLGFGPLLWKQDGVVLSDCCASGIGHKHEQNVLVGNFMGNESVNKLMGNKSVSRLMTNESVSRLMTNESVSRLLTNESVGQSVSKLMGMDESACWKLVLADTASQALPRTRVDLNSRLLVAANELQFLRDYRHKDNARSRYAELGRRYQYNWGQGFTYQKGNLVHLLMLAESRDAAAISFTFDSAIFDSSLAIKPEYIFDVDYVNLQYSPRHILTPVTPAEDRVGEILLSRAEMEAVESVSDYSSRYHKALMSVRPAAWIMDEVDFFRAKMTEQSNTNGEYVCLHLRIEPDFARMALNVHYYPLESILEKLRRSSSALGLKDRVLFVTGNHGNETIQQLSDSKIFKQVFTKDMLLPPVHPFRSTPSTNPRSLPASFDAEMCRGCKLFIGNCYSSWSEDIHDTLLFRAKDKEPQAALEGKTWSERAGSWMVNDHDRGASPLLPFCSNHHYTRHGEHCKYP